MSEVVLLLQKIQVKYRLLYKHYAVIKIKSGFSSRRRKSIRQKTRRISSCFCGLNWVEQVNKRTSQTRNYGPDTHRTNSVILTVVAYKTDSSFFTLSSKHWFKNTLSYTPYFLVKQRKGIVNNHTKTLWSDFTKNSHLQMLQVMGV
jgi:hypothetical protein